MFYEYFVSVAWVMSEQTWFQNVLPFLLFLKYLGDKFSELELIKGELRQ